LPEKVVKQCGLSACCRFDEMLKAAAETSVAIKANPSEADSVHCPFFTRHGVPIFDYYKKHPEYAGRFAKAMAGWRKSEYLSLLCLHRRL